MLYGIKYQVKQNGESHQVATYHKCKFVLDNLLSAMFVASALVKSHSDITYKIYKLEPKEAKQVKKENIASSVEEFKAMVDADCKKREKTEQTK